MGVSLLGDAHILFVLSILYLCGLLTRKGFCVEKNMPAAYFTAKAARTGTERRALGRQADSMRSRRKRPQVGVLSLGPNPTLPLLRWGGISCCLSVTRLEKGGFAKQNANLPVDGWRARVRAGETVSPGKSCHPHQNPDFRFCGCPDFFVF